MKTYGAFEAKTHFSSLLQRVERGETILITRHGQLVAELRPVSHGAVERTPGLYAGQIELSEDFDAPLDDFANHR